MDDTVFRLMAVLKVARVAAAETPSFVAAGTATPEGAEELHAMICDLRHDVQQQDPHSPDELASIYARTDILLQILVERRPSLGVRSRTEMDFALGILAARSSREMAAALRRPEAGG